MEFELWYYNGTVEERAPLFARSDVAAVVFTGAVTPEGEVGVYSGRTGGVVHVPAPALRRAVRRGLMRLGQGAAIQSPFHGSSGRLAVVNKTSGAPLYCATYFLAHSPGKVAKGRELVYTQGLST